MWRIYTAVTVSYRNKKNKWARYACITRAFTAGLGGMCGAVYAATGSKACFFAEKNKPAPPVSVAPCGNARRVKISALHIHTCGIRK